MNKYQEELLFNRQLIAKFREEQSRRCDGPDDFWPVEKWEERQERMIDAADRLRDERRDQQWEKEQ